MAVFLTGDTHGDFSRFKKGTYPTLDRLSKEDFVLICGDFGGVWDGSPEEQFWLDWLEQKPFTTLFVSGNHENYDLLHAFPVTSWHGGQVQAVRPSILHLMRGQIYHICDKTFFTMGGASSHDMKDGILEPDDPNFRQKRRRLNARGAQYRIHHKSWWEEELPYPAEYDTARSALCSVDWQVDYIVTHCCPARIQEQLSAGAYVQDELTLFFDEVWQRCTFQNWFFGHYHSNAVIAEKFVLLYEQIIQVL